MIFPLAPQGAELLVNKGQPGGYAGLDSSGDLTGIVIARTLTNATLATTALNQGELVYVTDTKQVVIGNSSTLGDWIKLQGLMTGLGSVPSTAHPADDYAGLWTGRNVAISTASGLSYFLSFGNDTALGVNGFPFSLIFNWDTLTFQFGDPSSPTGDNYSFNLYMPGNLTAGLALSGQTIATKNVNFGGGASTTITGSQSPSPGFYRVDATGGNITITLNFASFPTGYWKFVRKDATANTVTIVETSGKLISGAASQTLAGSWGRMGLWANNSEIDIVD